MTPHLFEEVWVEEGRHWVQRCSVCGFEFDMGGMGSNTTYTQEFFDSNEYKTCVVSQEHQ